MIIYCPDRCEAGVSHLVCIYLCPTSLKQKCKEYYLNYQTIQDLPAEQKYIDKYGLPEFPEPLALKKEKKQAKKQEKENKKAKPTKNKEEKPIKAKPVEEKKSKRKRRTKKEMEEARKKEK